MRIAVPEPIGSPLTDMDFQEVVVLDDDSEEDRYLIIVVKVWKIFICKLVF